MCFWSIFRQGQISTARLQTRCLLKPLLPAKDATTRHTPARAPHTTLAAEGRTERLLLLSWNQLRPLKMPIWTTEHTAAELIFSPRRATLTYCPAHNPHRGATHIHLMGAASSPSTSRWGAMKPTALAHSGWSTTHGGPTPLPPRHWAALTQDRSRPRKPEGRVARRGLLSSPHRPRLGAVRHRVHHTGHGQPAPLQLGQLIAHEEAVGAAGTLALRHGRARPRLASSSRRHAAAAPTRCRPQPAFCGAGRGGAPRALPAGRGRGRERARSRLSGGKGGATVTRNGCAASCVPLLAAGWAALAPSPPRVLSCHLGMGFEESVTGSFGFFLFWCGINRLHRVLIDVQNPHKTAVYRAFKIKESYSSIPSQSELMLYTESSKILTKSHYGYSRK